MEKKLIQKHQFCQRCKKITSHQAEVQSFEMNGPVLWANLILSFISCGIWIPFFIAFAALGVAGKTLAEKSAKWMCSECGGEQ